MKRARSRGVFEAAGGTPCGVGIAWVPHQVQPNVYVLPLRRFASNLQGMGWSATGLELGLPSVVLMPAAKYLLEPVDGMRSPSWIYMTVVGNGLCLCCPLAHRLVLVVEVVVV